MCAIHYKVMMKLNRGKCPIQTHTLQKQTLYELREGSKVGREVNGIWTGGSRG